MGYVSAGAVVHTSFPGSDVSPGQGFSITVPPLMPVAVGAYTAAIASVFGVAVVASQAGSVDLSGVDLDLEFLEPLAMSGVSDQDRLLIAEMSVDLTFTMTFQERADGSDLTHSVWMLGARVAGPERYTPSYSFGAGYAFHSFDFDNASDDSAGGPYVSAALQYYFPEEEIRLFCEYRRMYYVRAPESLPDDGVSQVVIGLTGQWYF